MADIAMLVAEEYERRVNNSRKSGQHTELLSCVGFVGQNLKGMKEKLRIEGQKMVEVLGKGVLEPQSQISLAATNGFFSA